MDCPACGRTVVDGAIFCNGCGHQIQDRCAACKALNPSGSAFCHSCGRRFDVATPATSEQAGRRQTAAATTSGSSEHAYLRRCPRCQTSNASDSLFCFSCGLPLDDTADSTAYAAVSAAGTPAGFWIRAVASLIDGVILVIGEVILILTFGSESSLTWVMVAIAAAYHTVGVSVWSTTFGKKAMGVYVLRPDGSKVGPARAFLRWLGYIPSTLLLLAGYLMVAFRSDKRAMHDLIADTAAVTRK